MRSKRGRTWHDGVREGNGRHVSPSRDKLIVSVGSVLVLPCLLVLAWQWRRDSHASAGTRVQSLAIPSAEPVAVASVASSFAEFSRERAAKVPGNRGLTVAVVGNGPVSEEYRKYVGAADLVIRFNDCSYFRQGDKIGLRVVRHPFPIRHELVSAPVWHVAPHRDLCEEHRPELPLSLCPIGAAVFTAVFQSAYGPINELDDSARIFPRCDARDSNLHAKRFGGPSSGGLVLSELEQTPHVARIHVFGMNWNGNPDLHIDFANHSLISSCCTKCTIFPTASASYGNKSKTYFKPNPDSFYRRMQGSCATRNTPARTQTSSNAMHAHAR